MKKYVTQLLNGWIERNIPTEMILSECDARKLIYLSKIRNSANSAELENGVSRIESQILPGPCSCKKVSFLVYESDKKAFRGLLNDYCMDIADKFDTMPNLIQHFASCQYEQFTNIMLRIR